MQKINICVNLPKICENHALDLLNVTEKEEQMSW